MISSLVDIRLPVMNGDEVCRRIRKNTPDRDIPIILMSGVVQDQDEIEKLKRELHVRAFLTKPFTSETLYMQIITTLQARVALLAVAPLPAAIPAPVVSLLSATVQ